MINLSSILGGGGSSGIGGSGKKAAYALITCNTTTTAGGFTLMDEDFCPAVEFGEMDSYNGGGPSPYVNLNSSQANMTGLLFSGSYTATQTSPASNSTNTYVNATNASGEFGNAGLDVFSDGIYKMPGRASSNTGWQNKHYLNASAINSDHPNKRIVYTLQSGNIGARDRLFGSYEYPMINTQDYAVTGISGSMQGTASYNYSRKEMVILSQSSSGGAFTCTVINGLDLAANPNPAVAFAQAGVTVTTGNLSLAASWAVNDSESYYNLKPVLNNDGSVFVAVMFTSNAQALYKFTPNGTTAVTGTYVTGQSLTTSYGAASGIQYGQRQITSRDGSSVAVFCPYYYYGSGVAAYMIDKATSTYTPYLFTNTSQGCQVLPYKDNGWAFYYAGNVYAGNPQGSYIQATFGKNGTSGFTQVGGIQYFSQFPMPNTTNYPGITQVADYSLLISNTGARP